MRITVFFMSFSGFCLKFRGHDPVLVSKDVVEHMELFQENRGLLQTGSYRVSAFVDAQILAVFADKVHGKDVVITDQVFDGLRNICSELGYHGFDELFQRFNQQRSRAMLSSGQNKIREVLADRRFPIFLQAGDAGLLKFLVERVSDLLELAFTTTDSIGTAAFEVLVNKRTRAMMYPPIIAKKIMGKMATRVFTQQPDHVLVSRFARVSRNIARFSKEGCLEVSPFMPELIRYVEEPDVLDVFETLLSDDEAGVFFQKCVMDAKFLEFLAGSAKAIDCPSHYGGRSLYCYGIFAVAAMCAHGSVLGPVIKQPEVIRSFLKPQPHAPIMIRNARWMAYLALLTPQNRAAFDPVFEEAVTALAHFDSSLHEYQLTIVQFLALISGISETFSRRLVTMNFADVLLGILRSFPNNTVGFRCVRKCLMHTYKNKILGPHVWTVLSFMADAISDRSQPNFILSSCCTGFFIVVLRKATTDQEIKTLLGRIPQTHPCWAVVRRTQELESQAYGGPMP